MKLIMLVDFRKLNQHALSKSLKEQAAKMLPWPWKYQGKQFLSMYLISQLNIANVWGGFNKWGGYCHPKYLFMLYVTSDALNFVVNTVLYYFCVYYEI